jgi:zinc D-Ala-D-Ala carboxypeptidase
MDIDNTPDDEADRIIEDCFAKKCLQPVRDHFGKPVKTVNSGYRCPESNAAVGGSKTSDHCKGQAADIEIDGLAKC